MGVRRVQSCVEAQLGEPVEQALSAPLWRGWTHPRDTGDGKKDS
jgi:hypothetical protein